MSKKSSDPYYSIMPNPLRRKCNRFFGVGRFHSWQCLMIITFCRRGLLNFRKASIYSRTQPVNCRHYNLHRSCLWTVGLRQSGSALLKSLLPKHCLYQEVCFSIFSFYYMLLHLLMYFFSIYWNSFGSIYNVLFQFLLCCILIYSYMGLGSEYILWFVFFHVRIGSGYG